VGWPAPVAAAGQEACHGARSDGSGDEPRGDRRLRRPARRGPRPAAPAAPAHPGPSTRSSGGRYPAGRPGPREPSL